MFVFYDTETTGIAMDYTQILQIGLLFTDADLNVLSSKKIDCRNSPWSLPAPGALLTTGFTPDDVKNSKNSNFELMKELDDWLRMKHWPLVFLGYNSINYDEPVLEQNFYQNLMPHNLTTSGNDENEQKNGRADVMRMVQLVSIYMPAALKLDIMNYYGSPSVSLKNVAQQNGVDLSDDDAHDALNDIKATVGVAKLIKKAAPQIWDQAIALATAEGVEEFLEDNELFTTAKMGRNKEIKSNVLTGLTAQKDSDTREALFDVRIDPTPYLNMTVAQLKDVLLGASGAPQNPFLVIEKDKEPALMPMDLSDPVLTDEDDEKVFKARAKKLKADKAFLTKVAKATALAHEEKLAEISSPGAPERQMDKDMPAAVKAKLDDWAKEFRDAADWKERAQMVSGFRTKFKNELAKDPSLDRFVKIAGRLVYEHAPEEISAAQQDGMKKFIAARLLNPDLNAPYMTIAKARKELQTIEWQRKKKDDTKWTEVTDTDIRRLKLYYTAIEKEYEKYSPYDKKPNKPANSNTPPNTDKKTSNGFNRNSPKP